MMRRNDVRARVGVLLSIFSVGSTLSTSTSRPTHSQYDSHASQYDEYYEHNSESSAFDEFGCFSNSKCAESCGTSCISECCRDETCLEETDPARWLFPVKYGDQCYLRCYDECAYEWEDHDSCPGVCMHDCESECTDSGYEMGSYTGRLEVDWEKQPDARQVASDRAAARCYTMCYYPCALKDGCLTCSEECNLLCIQESDGSGVDAFACMDGDVSAGGCPRASADKFEECYTSCNEARKCLARMEKSTTHGYEYDTNTGIVKPVHLAPITPQEQCQEDCIYRCEDQCGQYDSHGVFDERTPGCYEKCFTDCTQVGGCTDQDLKRQGIPLPLATFSDPYDYDYDMNVTGSDYYDDFHDEL